MYAGAQRLGTRQIPNLSDGIQLGAYFNPSTKELTMNSYIVLTLTEFISLIPSITFLNFPPNDS